MGEKIITQIGSLPYKDVKEAVAYSLKHDIPFLPELPKLGDSMLDYIKSPGKLSCLKEFKKHDFSLVKIQCVGPATLLMSGDDEEDALSKISEHISIILDGLNSEKIILFLDEPALGQAGFNWQGLWASIFESFKVIPGVHCCGNMNWDVLFGTPEIEYISFDASQFDIAKYPQYRCDKKIAWGAEKIEDVKDFRTGDLLTPPCGMGSPKYTVADCGTELKKLKAIKEQYQRR